MGESLVRANQRRLATHSFQNRAQTRQEEQRLTSPAAWQLRDLAAAREEQWKQMAQAVWIATCVSPQWAHVLRTLWETPPPGWEVPCGKPGILLDKQVAELLKVAPLPGFSPVRLSCLVRVEGIGYDNNPARCGTDTPKFLRNLLVDAGFSLWHCLGWDLHPQPVPQYLFQFYLQQ